jgi:hypothetical protein
MRRFELHRTVDETGISGTGVVAQGNEFDDGTCVMRWTVGPSSTAVYDSIVDIDAIHGHGGKTQIVWLDS